MTAEHYKVDFTTATLAHKFDVPADQTAFDAVLAADADIRLIQARPDPQNPAESPQVYAYYTAIDMFSAAVSGTDLNWTGKKTFSTRFNFYYPIDIGHHVIANFGIHPCGALPATDLDYWTAGSIHFRQLADDAETCQDYVDAATKFD